MLSHVGTADAGSFPSPPSSPPSEQLLHGLAVVPCMEGTDRYNTEERIRSLKKNHRNSIKTEEKNNGQLAWWEVGGRMPHRRPILLEKNQRF